MELKTNTTDLHDFKRVPVFLPHVALSVLLFFFRDQRLLRLRNVLFTNPPHQEKCCLLNSALLQRNILERLWRKRRKCRRWRKRERARAGIEPTAAAPSQPDCPGVSRSDHSAGSKESASWRALRLRSDWQGRLGVGRREELSFFNV